ncbi:MAG: IS110 family transposase [Acidobacteria bacterium]|nr:IS110 family transposase [Acidobacteriota bacterium]
MTLHSDVATAGAAEDYAAFVAIDWADKKHVWVLQKAGSSDRQQGEIEASPEAVDAWVSELLLRFPGRRIAVALEQKRGALLCLLSKYEALVLYPVHPATVSGMRSALYPSSSKDDPKDAHLLLDLLVYHRHRLRRLDADTVETRKLQILVEDRRKLVDEQTGYSNQLRAKLKLYYPQALRWLPELHSTLAGDFLQRWPTLPLLQKARPGTLRQFLQEHNCRSEEWIQRRLEEIPKAMVATTDPAVVDSSVAMVRALVALLGTLRTHIAEFDRQIAATAAVHPELPIMDSLPGAGPVMVPRLLAAMGTQRERFACASELAAMTGIAPVKQDSGQSQWTHFRWKCPKFLRQTFHEWAGHSIAQSKWAKAYYDDQIRKNKRHHAAVRALAFKWQRILFRCWKDHQPYDEQKYLQALRRRGSPLAQALS